MNDFESDNYIAILGLRRSGNHATFSWILPHFRHGLVRYYHNASLKPNRPRPAFFVNCDAGTFNVPIDAQQTREFRRNQNRNRNRRRPHRENFPYRNIPPNTTLSATIVGFENPRLETFENDFAKWCDHYSVKREQFKIVTVIRNPLNVLASVLRHPSTLIPHKHIGELWCQFAEEHTSKRYLNGNVVHINYDRWFEDLKYRQNLSQSLKLEWTDAGLNVVDRAGNGSSFDQMDYQGRAQEMNVLNRWREYENQDELRNKLKMFYNERFLSLYEEIYGEFPLTKEDLF